MSQDVIFTLLRTDVQVLFADVLILPLVYPSLSSYLACSKAGWCGNDFFIPVQVTHKQKLSPNWSVVLDRNDRQISC